MIEINSKIIIDDSEIQIIYIRSPGPGGQNVNKVATGVQLRFNVIQSPSIPDPVKQRLIAQLGNKLTVRGELIIKAIRYRTQLRNKQDAIERLKQTVLKAVPAPKKRKKTKPTASSREKRLEKKRSHSQTKSLRGKISRHDF